MRVPQRVRLTPAEIKQDKQSYIGWLRMEAANNTEQHDRLISNMLRAIREMLTDKQRMYLLDYYVDGLTMDEIGELHGVNKSTVSRTIFRGKEKLYQILRFSDPQLLAIGTEYACNVPYNKRTENKQRQRD